MNEEELIELTNKLYRLTLLFPKKEPLRYKIREAADDLLAAWIGLKTLQNPSPNQNVKKERDLIFELAANAKILDSYLEVAKWQDWASFFDILEVQKQYGKLGSGIKEKKENSEKLLKEIPEVVIPDLGTDELEKKAPSISSQKPPDNELDTRKKKILEYLGTKGTAQVWEINKIFPTTSKRTLRRDVHFLLKKGLVERIGDKNDTFYQPI